MMVNPHFVLCARHSSYLRYVSSFDPHSHSILWDYFYTFLWKWKLSHRENKQLPMVLQLLSVGAWT